MAELIQLADRLSIGAFVVCSMMAMGFRLTLAMLIAPLHDGRWVLLALVLNFVIAPAFAWVLTKVLALGPGHAIGLMLVASAAGAPFLPKLVENARGDFALAAALVVLLTAGTLVFMPAALPSMISGVRVSAWEITAPLGLLIVAPFVAGMCVNRYVSVLADRAAPVLSRISNICLVILFGFLLVRHFRSLIGVVGSGAIFAAGIHIIGLFGIAWCLGGSDRETRATLALATSARNFGAAMVPAATSFHDPDITTMVIVCAIMCLVLTFAAARWVRDHGG